MQAPQLPGSCLLARRDVLDKLGLYDEDFTLGVEDTDLCYRVRQAGYELWFLPACEAMHLHAQSRRQLGRAARELPMIDGLALFCRKHYATGYRRGMAVLEGLLLAREGLVRLLLVALSLGLSRKAREALAVAWLRRRLVVRLWQA